MIGRRALLALFILAFGAVLAAGGCAGRGPASETEKTEEEASMGEDFLRFEHAFTKVRPLEGVRGAGEYTIYTAKNEYEGCQIVLQSLEDMDGLTIEYSQFENAAGQTLKTELFTEYFIHTGEEWAQDGYDRWPDPIVPYSGGFSLRAWENAPFLLRVYTPKDAGAGEYSAKLRILRDGELIHSSAVSLRVWDFALPEEKSCATAMALYGQFIDKFHPPADSEEALENYIKYYELLLENGVSAYGLPYDILDPRADAYMDDPRVTSFTVPYSEDDGIIRAYYEKLSKNPGWMKKAFFYPLDEPTTEEAYGQVLAVTERLERLFPGYNIVLPFFKNPDVGDIDAIEYITGRVNIWCPKSYAYDDENIYSPEQREKYPSFEERMRERQKAGDRVWWYVCWEPGEPYCNMYVDMEGALHRILFWQQKYFGVEGFLYWCVNYWPQTDDPWKDMRTVKDLSTEVFGDGSLLYNGSKLGIDGPVSSLRLEAVRDGVEDFEILTLAEKSLGTARTRKLIEQIIAGMTSYERDGDVFAAARTALGNELEQSLKK